MKASIQCDLIGEAWPAVQPFQHPQMYGSVELEPRGEFVARRFASFVLTYTAGRYGIDDSGAIRVSFRLVGDWGRFQTSNPKAPNYASASTNGEAKLVLDVNPIGKSPMPRNKGRPIRRSSHALLTDQSDMNTDACDAQKLFADLSDEDCIVYAHVGGRYANVAFAHDPAIETAMEIHSAWGTFEWLMADCFSLGFRVGVVCNSDDHKGRPGASYPGASTFGAYGGLTCFLAEELTRDGIFECLRRRRHYGTTGTRLYLDVRSRFLTDGFVFDRDPNVFTNTKPRKTQTVMMGDIAHTRDQAVMLRFEAVTQAGIERIEIRNGTEVIQTIRPYGSSELGSRIRVIWSGAEYRGRGRETLWHGKAMFTEAAIRYAQEINFWNRERKLEIDNRNTLTWESITTGNFSGFDVWLDEKANSCLKIETNLGTLSVDLSDLDMEETTMAAGGLDRCIRVFRLPDHGLPQHYDAEIPVNIMPGRDNPLWVCLTMEDGSQAWSSPIYLYNAK